MYDDVCMITLHHHFVCRVDILSLCLSSLYPFTLSVELISFHFVCQVDILSLCLSSLYPFTLSEYTFIELCMRCALFDYNVNVICLSYVPTTLVEQTILLRS